MSMALSPMEWVAVCSPALWALTMYSFRASGSMRRIPRLSGFPVHGSYVAAVPMVPMLSRANFIPESLSMSFPKPSMSPRAITCS